ncbi:MAG: zinc ribbon domain-containing protein, partial [Pseudomonas sp.]|nr:zinc ribbon domain-containing protein [Pseudomonas sp.]
MAVGKCKECGGQVASSAKACPHCGAKVKKSVGILGWLFVLLVVLPIAWKFGTGMGA